MNDELNQIVDALAVTAEALGDAKSPAGLALMAQDLEPYGYAAVSAALVLLRRECRRLTVADVIDRLEGQDGRPRSDEAFANALGAIDEAETVVWTDEAAQAFEAARPLLELNDKTGARMAFRDAYERLCADARAARKPARWSVSMGWDSARRAAVLEAAVQTGRLGAEYARALLPPPVPEPGRLPAMLALAASNGVLTDAASSAIERQKARDRIAALKAMLSGPQEGAA
jgi:hypothetical protein